MMMMMIFFSCPFFRFKFFCFDFVFHCFIHFGFYCSLDTYVMEILGKGQELS